MTLVFLVRKRQQIIRKVLTLNLRVALDELKDPGAAENLNATVAFLLSLHLLDLEKKVDLSVCLFFLFLSKRAFLELFVDAISILGLG